MTEDRGHIKGTFDASKDPSVIVPAHVNQSNIAIGKTYVYEFDPIPAKDADKLFGYDALEFAKMDKPMQEVVQASFVHEQTERFMEARRLLISSYEKYVEDVRNSMYVEQEGDIDTVVEMDLMLLQDDGLSKKILEEIEERGKSAEAATESVYMAQINQLLKLPDTEQFAAIRSKAELFRDHMIVLQHHLHPTRVLSSLREAPEGSIIFAKTLPPAEMFSFIDKDTGKLRFSGLVLTEASTKGHTAIVAKSLGIPFAYVDPAHLPTIKTGYDCIIDGVSGSGAVVFHPGAAIMGEFTAQKELLVRNAEILAQKHDPSQPLTTLDGTEAHVFGNIGATPEAPMFKEALVEGIGLYRTEMAENMRSDSAPVISEDHWMKIFRANLKACSKEESGYIVATIRTLDIAGDKAGRFASKSPEEKAAYELKVMATQMGALVRLNHELEQQGHHGKIKIMIPMVSSPERMNELQKQMDTIAQERGVPTMQLGCMGEIPALFDEDSLERLNVSFMSIGSNDLIYGLLDTNRYHASSSVDYDPTLPGLLDRLERAADWGERKGIPISICGDMASDPQYVPLVIGSGITTMSAGIQRAPLVREIVSRIDRDEAKELVELIKSTNDQQMREKILAHFCETRLGLWPGGQLDMEWSESKRTPFAPQKLGSDVTEEPPPP